MKTRTLGRREKIASSLMEKFDRRNRQRYGVAFSTIVSLRMHAQSLKRSTDTIAGHLLLRKAHTLRATDNRSIGHALIAMIAIASPAEVWRALNN